VCFERIVPLVFTELKALPKHPPGVVILKIGIPGIFDAGEMGLKL
jgi:hypothetical protein